MKICSCCKQTKSFDEFSKNKSMKDGLSNQCKVCKKETQKNYMTKLLIQNPNYNQEFYKQRLKNHPNYNKEKYLQEKESGQSSIRRKNFRLKNPDYEKKGSLQFNNLKKRRTIKYKTDPLYKLKVNVRNTMLRGLTSRKICVTEKILGCSYFQLKKHLQSKFDSRMNWNNHGKFGWHIDHIIPLASAKNDEDVYKLNHFTNLQPLWWKDNLMKSDKIYYE